ncbi:MAG TPA: hypothetical protein VEW08_11310 [Steroidobacteraceae bacterium]|nr:hypothetical protein [Steroidobacteraceae bacterium]
MSKLVAGLAVSTAVCAAAAVYFRQQLVMERENSAHLASELAIASAPRAPAPKVVATPSAPAAPIAPATSVTEPAQKAAVTKVSALESREAPRIMTDAQKSAMRAQATDFLGKYDSPGGRARLRDQQIERTRALLEGFDKDRNLAPGAWQKLIEEVADTELEKRAVISRCALDPACVTPALSELLASRKQALQELLGDEGLDEMKNWAMTEPARRSVKGLSARLPSTAPLSSAQSSALVAALTAEREAAMRDFANEGTHIKGFSNVDRMSLFYADALPAEGRMASAEAYVQRTRARAATVLAGEQLITFNQLQDDLLHDFRRMESRRTAEQKP